MALSENTQSLGRQRSRLVESALRQTTAMQRNRHHQHFLRGILSRAGSHLRDRLRKPRTQFAGHRGHPVVLQRMQSRAHRAFIDATTHRVHKRRRRHPAGSTVIRVRRTARQRGGFKQVFAASRAAILALRRNLCPASLANGRVRNLRQKAATKGAAGGKKSATQYMTQSTQKICGRKSRRTPNRSSRSGDASRKITRDRARVATEVAPQSRQAMSRRRGNSIRRRDRRKLFPRASHTKFIVNLHPTAAPSKKPPSGSARNSSRHNHNKRKPEDCRGIILPFVYDALLRSSCSALNQSSTCLPC